MRVMDFVIATPLSPAVTPAATNPVYQKRRRQRGLHNFSHRQPGIVALTASFLKASHGGGNNLIIGRGNNRVYVCNAGSVCLQIHFNLLAKHVGSYFCEFVSSVYRSVAGRSALQGRQKRTYHSACSGNRKEQHQCLQFHTV